MKVQIDGLVARLQYFQRISSGNTAVLHLTIDLMAVCKNAFHYAFPAVLPFQSEQ